MNVTEEVQKLVWYTSDVHPDIRTTNKELGEVIAWADAQPLVWMIVMGAASHAFGRNSSDYMGYQRGPSPEAALGRAATFKRILDSDDSFWTWRARFTLAHYKDKGFKRLQERSLPAVRRHLRPRLLHP